ncbi:Dienelactone hydrolase-like enzyme [Candidatus Nitrospira nitrosa]|uniref:Dienelactone hydrolase-like enzyme n=1 Tax=Candidatus Nitrospira nitrosa TaxID=1742972 RepID=A0A0S4LPH1_9BACT|nr:dienelactone hydrolase family protein [Candidatus Nitrospira nitrosa]CUS37908.1 Dienelactone hydrolase-like enzyme [Candidatus Nitrospira nitrosa]
MVASIRETTAQYQSGNVGMKAFVAAPQTKDQRPAILIVQEWWGLTEYIKDIARRYAAEGYVAIAPDLYSRLGHALPTDAGEAGKLMNALKQEDGLTDLNATVAYLKSVPEVDATRIGVTGFCMGGSYALMLPCVSSEIKAAVPFYGQVPNPDTPIQKLACPVLYLYGEDDGWITKVDVQRLVAALKKYNKTGEIKTYPGAPHAFFRDTDPTVYRPEAAQDAWARTKAFFKQHLG